MLNILDERLDTENLNDANQLRLSLQELGQLRSDNQLSQMFWPLLAEKLAGIVPTLNIQTLPANSQDVLDGNNDNSEISLLEAITHEVRKGYIFE